jgi:3-oxoacyl-[acyl-carrier protein] reductase
MNLELAGKHALVTGGSRGIGRAIALALARQGVEVAACYRNDSEDVERLGRELAEAGPNNVVIKADLGDEVAVAKLVSEVRDRYGTLEILVNNAGVVSHATIADLELDEWRRVLDTNLTALFLVTKGLVDSIPSGGSIIIIGSAVATRGMVGRTHYASSKAGAIGFMRALCKEVGPRGIRVNLIAPGIIETDQVSGLTEEGRARYSGLAALSRLGKPDEIAGAALFLASDLSAFVSGVTLNVDGGI